METCFLFFYQVKLDAQGACTRASYQALRSSIGRLPHSTSSSHSIVRYFTSRFSISEQHFSEECFNYFLVCLATTTGLRLSIRHLSLQDSTSTYLSVSSLPSILAKIMLECQVVLPLQLLHA